MQASAKLFDPVKVRDRASLYSIRMYRRAWSRSAGKRRVYESPERLSRRELQVLKLVVDGHTNSHIAALLGLSPKSVETYRGRVMVKLKLENLPALVKFAIRHGITTLD